MKKWGDDNCIMETGRENCDTGIVQENGMRSYWQEDGAAGRKSIYVYG